MTFLQLPLEIETIILDYQFELEHEDRIENHKERFEECLNFIEDFNHYIHQNINDELLINITEEHIEITYNELSMSIPNMNKWYPEHEEMVVDLLQNYQRKWFYEDKRDFIEEMCIEDEDFEKVDIWWNSMVVMFNFINEIVENNYKIFYNKESFADYIEEL